MVTAAGPPLEEGVPSFPEKKTGSETGRARSMATQQQD